MTEFFVYDGKNETGPFTIEQLKKQKLTRYTSLRPDGSDKWTTADAIPELKDLYVPRKINSAKDVVPVVLNRAADLHRKKPLVLYSVFFLLALVIGVSFYSLGSNGNKKVQKAIIRQQPEMPTGVSNSNVAVVKNDTATIKKDLVQPVDDKEKSARIRWKKLFTVSNSNYGIGVLGGIKDLKIVFHNNSDYPVEQVIAKLTYIKSNGDVWKTKMINIYGVPANENKEQAVPDVNRGKKITLQLYKVVSKKMKFSYTEGQAIKNPKDPYYSG